MADFAAENPPEKAAEQIPVSFLDEILDPSLDSIPGLKASDSNEEEEELEWLLNKDAFPPLETMVTSAPSPVSVLAMKVPVKARSKSSRKKRETLPRILAAERRKCRHCEAEETPQWRTGPEGPKTLCNACGVRFRKGRLVEEYRPINSPTFRAELHSNSHKRIVGMKRRKVEVEVEVEEVVEVRRGRGRPRKF